MQLNLLARITSPLQRRGSPQGGQDGRAPRKREGERPEAGAAGPVPEGSRHNMHHT
ncbi:MAG: hypothetical protein OXC18_20060 [Desulfurellaceae bacterium]|nr:hypothetical protein [Desulfurellaceae bacterium]